jgi:hypothetical protein
VLKAVVGNTWRKRFGLDLTGDEVGPIRFIRGNQALPIWNMSGDCLVMTRGDGEEFVLMDLATNTYETISVELPEADSRERPDPEMDSMFEAMGAKIPDGGPVAVARVIDLVVDPDGVLWVLPATRWPRGGRGPRGTARRSFNRRICARYPAWLPESFTDDGRDYGLRSGSSGEFLLSLYFPATSGPMRTTPSRQR